jgi:hypothetical protein
MTTDGLPNYRFADLTLDVTRRSVTRQGRAIELKALDFDLLRFLVEQAPNSERGHHGCATFAAEGAAVAAEGCDADGQRSRRGSRTGTWSSAPRS